MEGERLPREDLLDILGLLMIAGLDTVAASLACFLSYLARHPDDRRRLVADPSLWPSAIEELMRYESPVTDGGRIALADLELPSGEHVAAGTKMGISWHAANLDPDAFDDPLTVDFDARPEPPHRVRQRLPPLPRLASRSDGDARRAGGLAPADPRLRDRDRLRPHVQRQPPRSAPSHAHLVNLADTPIQAARREEIRDWLAEHLTGEFARHPGVGGPTDDSWWELRLAWERELADGGWLGITWPVEYGGRGGTLEEELVFLEEHFRARAPYWVGVHGRDLFGPTLLHAGSNEQKARFLPRIMRCEDMWGQGFSEPEAGSDLGGVRTRAVRDGDEWVLNGQKIWMTFGTRADWLYVLCRTDPDAPKHRGLSLILVPADQPGVDIRPIRNLADGAEFAEVFFTDARTRGRPRRRPRRRRVVGRDGNRRHRTWDHRAPLPGRIRAAAARPRGGAPDARADDRPGGPATTRPRLDRPPAQPVQQRADAHPARARRHPRTRRPRSRSCSGRTGTATSASR